MKIDQGANAPRLIVPHGVLKHGGWRIKVYGFGYPQQGARAGLVSSGEQWAKSFIDTFAPEAEHYSVGFLGLHDGNGYCQLFIDWWAAQNELFQVVKLAKKDDPSQLYDPPPGHNIACIYDQAVQWHEREAWGRHVLRNPAGPDLDAYLEDFLQGSV